MELRKIHLKEFYNLENDPVLEVADIETLDHDVPKKPIVLIAPGGGYGFVSKREGDPIAINFLLKNFVTAKLIYTVKVSEEQNYKYPIPQLEMLASVDFLRKHADEFNIDMNRLVLIGFSAGGHLVGSFSYKYAELAGFLDIKRENLIKPKAVVLCYPVITFGKLTHNETKRRLTNNDATLFDELSIEKNVKRDYPATFIWTTKDDNCVPYENTVLMDEALNKAGVTHKTIIYNHGCHGLSLANELVANCDNEINEDVATWVGQMFDFLKEIKII